MNRMAISLVLAALSAGVVVDRANAAQTEIVRLTIDEASGVDRVNEPVTMGVPLPEGAVADASRLVLLDAAGKRVPCQVTEVSRWLDGKSIKWVHLTWRQSVKAKGKEAVTLALRDLPELAPKAGLSAVQAGETVTVQTGYVKFVVRGPKFNGIDAAWFDPTGKNQFQDANQVIGGAGGGSEVVHAPRDSVTIENEKPSVTGETKSYLSGNDPKGQVVIEERGPQRVVIKAAGRHLAGSEKVLDYIVRVYAYADSPVVRVSHTFVSAQGEKSTDMHFLAALNLDVPTRLGGGTVTVGTEKVPISAGPAAAIHQDTSDSFTVSAGEKALATGKGKSTKPATTGWIDLTKGQLGLAVGVKWFWQMFPKKLSVDAKGRVRVALYPAGSRPLEVYMGQSRTHYLTFVFHDARTNAGQLNAIFAGAQRPLRAWASPKYYCRDTHCFGYAIEDEKELFGERWADVQRHGDVMLKSVKMLLKKIDGNEYNNVSRDSYGIYAWGDRFHWGWPKWGVSPFHTEQWRQSWAGNYYDHPNAMLMQFLRTGEKTFLERYWPNAVQIGDVHTCNYHPRKELIGACRYCPPRNFVAVDNGNPYVSNEFNHYKTQSVYAHWYLTGDYRSLDHCRMLANNALVNRAADSGWAARGMGAQLGGLWNAYELWRDPQYLRRMQGLAKRAMAQFRNGKYRIKGTFMWGIANEGLCYYYWVSGDPQVIETFKSGFPKCKGKTGYANMALGLAMTYRVTGDERFRDWAWKAIGTTRPSSRVHGPGCQFRSTAFALFFLSDASKGWKPYTAGPVPAAAMK